MFLVLQKAFVLWKNLNLINYLIIVNKMKLIKPSFEILEQGFSIDAIYKHIELCGRTCYKSADKITKDSATPFVNRMINSKHYAMLEHGTVYLKIPYDILHRIIHPGLCSKYINNPYTRCSKLQESIDSLGYFNQSLMTYLLVTTNLRVIVENGWEKDLEYICEPHPNHIKRYTVKFIANIHFYKDLTRHRNMSYAIESTRFCNYSKNKFGGELTFIQPCWLDEKYISGEYNRSEQFIMFTEMLENIESTYNFMINNGWQAQQAATLLPQATKAEIIITGFIEDWKHIFNLRAIGTTGKPHPQMLELMVPLMKEFIKRKYLSNYD
uniref:ThyX n=1 Tax=Geladintestivirus 5 TaxID=3233137 RepID=A0AAU8MJS5_9CAUD